MTASNEPNGRAGGPHTYARFKDFLGGAIPAPSPEGPIDGLSDNGGSAYMSYFDDDMGANTTVQEQMNFLHNRYFPRVHWARLTLSPTKSFFCMTKRASSSSVVGVG